MVTNFAALSERFDAWQAQWMRAYNSASATEKDRNEAENEAHSILYEAMGLLKEKQPERAFTSADPLWRVSDAHGLCVVEDIPEGRMIADFDFTRSDRVIAEWMVKRHNAEIQS